MSLQAVSLIVCLLLALVASDTGVHFVMERHTDSYFCGHLQCVADLTKSDQDVSAIVDMTIYDITGVNWELKLASVSVFHPDLYVDTTKSSAVSCTGTISRLQANLTLQLHHGIDCLYGVYKCQLDVITESGHPEVLTATVVPENNHSYSRDAEMINNIDALPEMFNIYTNLVSNQAAEISQLGSQFDKQTAKLSDQTVEISKLGSRFDSLTAQIGYQNSKLHNMTERLDLETTKQKQQNEAVEARLMTLDLKLDTIHKLSNLMADMFHDQIEQESMNGTEKYSCRCGRWLADNKDNKETAGVIPTTAASTIKPLPCDHFVITMKTGGRRYAATDASVYIIMHSVGQNEDTSETIWLQGGQFRRDGTDIFNVNVAKMFSPLTKIEVGHDNNKDDSGWFLESVTVYCPTTGIEQYFPYYRWLATDEGDGLIHRTLYEQNSLRKPK